MAVYRSGQDEPRKTPEELRQWLADLHKGLDEAKAKAEAEWDPSMMKNEPIGEQQPKPKQGPKGGRYTEAVTKDGVPYRRYF